MDNDKLVDILDKYDAGIIGEEADGAKRVAFTRCCEMVGTLVEELHAIGLDICFPSHEQGSSSLHLTIMPIEECESVPHELLSDFKWLPNKLGQYTFKKSAMQGVNVGQLFLQLKSNFIPAMLEDEPGTDNFYLHVEKIGQDHTKAFSKRPKTDVPSSKPFSFSNYFGITLMLAGVGVAFYDRVFGPIDIEQWV